MFKFVTSLGPQFKIRTSYASFCNSCGTSFNKFLSGLRALLSAPTVKASVKVMSHLVMLQPDYKRMCRATEQTNFRIGECLIFYKSAIHCNSDGDDGGR